MRVKERRHLILVTDQQLELLTSATRLYMDGTFRVVNFPIVQLYSVHAFIIFFFPLSGIMDLRHQSSAMCIIMLGGEDTHPWSATNVGNPIPDTIPVDW